MSGYCCGIGRFIVDYFQLPLSAKEAYGRIKEEAKYTYPKQKKEYRDTTPYSSAGIPVNSLLD